MVGPFRSRVTGEEVDVTLYALCVGLALGWISMALFLAPLIIQGLDRQTKQTEIEP